jgi:hypothetical protein
MVAAHVPKPLHEANISPSILWDGSRSDPAPPGISYGSGFGGAVPRVAGSLHCAKLRARESRRRHIGRTYTDATMAEQFQRT